MSFLDATSLTAKIAGAPVELAKTVKDSAANAEASVGLELDIFAGIEFIDGVDKTENSGVDKIVELDVRRKAIVDAACDVADLGEIFREEALALDGIESVWLRSFVGSGQHRALPCPRNVKALAEVIGRSPETARKRLAEFPQGKERRYGE
jgi:hypothetical protein